ncbi:MAG: hypothetical protein EXR58_00035 [Chloroflexi bacterium]|nr:hypothetical protein [Chloroflexota bacterium]
MTDRPQHRRMRWAWGPMPGILGALGLLFSSVALAQEMDPTMLMSGDTALGAVLTDSAGMALYTWDRDDPKATTVATTPSATWPLLLTTGAPMVPAGMTGVGMAPRLDGSMHVTYNGWPLYNYINDKAPGQTLGDGVGGTWHAVMLSDMSAAPMAEAPAATSATTVSTAKDTQGRDVLIDGKGMSLYVLAQDQTNDNKSTCYADNECTVYWPPVLVDVAPATPGFPGELGTQKRADFTTQLTYKGRPLYTYLDDQKPGDMFGNNLTDEWGRWFLIPA